MEKVNGPGEQEGALGKGAQKDSLQVDGRSHAYKAKLLKKDDSATLVL